jgi:hypothetical protein
VPGVDVDGTETGRRSDTLSGTPVAAGPGSVGSSGRSVDGAAAAEESPQPAAREVEESASAAAAATSAASSSTAASLAMPAESRLQSHEEAGSGDRQWAQSDSKGEPGQGRSDERNERKMSTHDKIIRI